MRPKQLTAPERPTGRQGLSAMRVAGAIVVILLSGVSLVLWVFERILRGSTCGPAEGGESCEAGILSWALLGGTVIGLIVGAALLAGLPRRASRS